MYKRRSCTTSISLFYGSLTEIHRHIKTAVSRWHEIHTLVGKRTAYYHWFTEPIGERNASKLQIIKVILKEGVFATAFLVTDTEVQDSRQTEAIRIGVSK